MQNHGDKDTLRYNVRAKRVLLLLVSLLQMVGGPSPSTRFVQGATSSQL